MAYITFERFGKKKQWDRDKEIFLYELRLLISRLTKNKENKEFYSKANEIEIAIALKQMLAKKNYDNFA